MSSQSFSFELQTVLEDLGNNSHKSDQIDPERFERIARWRRACGDADGAATWQTWSLLPPEPKELRRTLSQLWLQLGRTERAAEVLNHEGGSSEDSWERLSILLKQGTFKEASALQLRLLKQPPALDVQVLVALGKAWKLAGRPQQALDLLQPMLIVMQKRGVQPTAPVCNTVAALHDELNRRDESEQWWMRSHRLQPQQTRPLIRLARHALRKHEYKNCVHYAMEALKRDPDHQFAPDLQKKGLVGMGALNSLALIQGDPLEPRKADPQFQPPDPQLWLECRRLALVGFAQATIIESWFKDLADQPPGPKQNSLKPPLQIWLINSPDPLWLLHEVQQLQSMLDQPIEIELWPTWDSQRHGSAQLVFEFESESPGWKHLQPKAC